MSRKSGYGELPVRFRRKSRQGCGIQVIEDASGGKRMSAEIKEDMQRVCEAVIKYHKGLEEIDKYIRNLNGYVDELNEKLESKGAAEAFEDYGRKLEGLREQTDKLNGIFEAMRDGQSGMKSQLGVLWKFKDAVEAFEETMKEFNLRADALSQRLYNKDFNNAIKAMNAIAEDSKQSGTYEYRHKTGHDYDILVHEYETALKSCSEKHRVKAFLEAVYDMLCETKLKKAEYEALQRLMEKMVHSDSESLKRFLKEISKDIADEA